MRKIDKIIIHCADTPEGKYFDIDDIRKWHVEERGWSDVGYHYVILLDGSIQLGRPIQVSGAHTKGFNSQSIGICYIGGMNNIDTRTCEQKNTLEVLLSFLRLTFKEATIQSHKDFTDNKSCPSFDATNEYKNI
tara:strand:+ start:40 stop:441 length:402 start_codon:yes stop_codon:yes gene_type:complete